MRYSEKIKININLNKLLIFLIIFCRENGDLSENNIIYLGLIVLSLIGIVGNGIKKKYLLYTKWFLGFMAIFACSVYWSINRTYTINALIGTFARGILMIYISLYMTSWKRIFNVMNIYIVSFFCLNLYLIAFKGLKFVTELRDTVSNEGSWNSNSIGMMAALAVFFCILIIGYEKGKYKIFGNSIYYIMIFVSVLMCFISASKKAIIMLIILNVGYWALSKKHNRIIWYALAVLIIPLVYLIITRVNILYNIFGYRIEQLILGMLGYQKYTVSDHTRMFLIRLGIEKFWERSYWGYGMGTFKDLYVMAGGTRALYSHNNYIELLIGIGFIGTLVYYSIHLYILKNVVKWKRGKEKGFALTLWLMLIIIDYGLVSYSQISFMIIMAMLVAVVRIQREGQEKKIV